jgi:hypothetical protein
MVGMGYWIEYVSRFNNQANLTGFPSGDSAVAIVVTAHALSLRFICRRSYSFLLTNIQKPDR